MATEEPAFEVLARDGTMEIRKYAPFIVAETLVEGDMDEATGRGFRLIADYIFGNNVAPGAGTGSSKIAMTAPVTVAPEPANQKIAMTAPVTIEPQADGTDMQATRRWRVHFVMPSQYTMSSLPKPRNAAVSLREVPAKFFAVTTYSGLNGIGRVQQKTDALMAWVKDRRLTVQGAVQFARYDPPWTLPMWRRNEVMVEIAAP